MMGALIESFNDSKSGYSGQTFVKGGTEGGTGNIKTNEIGELYQPKPLWGGSDRNKSPTRVSSPVKPGKKAIDELKEEIAR